MDGTDALRIDKAELLHMLKTKTTVPVELGPVIQNLVTKQYSNLVIN